MRGSRRIGARGVRIARASIFCLACLGCAASKQFTYNISPDVPPENRARLIERAEKGRILFKNNCSDCHGIFTAGRDSVPNFTNTQLDSYNAGFVKGEQKNHAVARKLSQQQVDYILTFLRLRKMPAP